MAIFLIKLSTFQWIQIYTLTYFITLSIGSSATASQISYSDHCSSFVPEAIPDSISDSADTFPLPPSNQHVGYYSGNLSNILKTLSPSYQPSQDSSNYLSFQTREVQKTDRGGILKVEADLTLRVLKYETLEVMERSYRGSSFHRRAARRKRTRSQFLFRLEGFWSESSGRLCMVGSTPTFSASEREVAGDSDLTFHAVFKMEKVENPVSITSLFTGTLQSFLSSGHDKSQHLDSISILMFPKSSNYHYGKQKGDSGGRNLPVGLSFESGRFCQTLQQLMYRTKLKYATNCYNRHSSNSNCNPFKSGNSDSLPRAMSWKFLDCLEGKQKVRVLLDFSMGMGLEYYGSLDPNTTLVGEGYLVEDENILRIEACRILAHGGNFSAASVEDCSIQLRLVFQAKWSIKDRNGFLGEIRSRKRTDEPGYFEPISIEDTSYNQVSWWLPGLKYEYTEAERVKSLCPVKNMNTVNTNVQYPDQFSRDLSFHFTYLQEPGKEKKIDLWGSSYPLFIGNRPYDGFDYEISGSGNDSGMKTNSSTKARLNVAYDMSVTSVNNSITNGSFSRMDIYAEGVYDTKTGILCMVGCRSLENSTTDCEILAEFQFPPLGSKRSNSKDETTIIKGSIESTRPTSDPLYFRRMNVSGSALYVEYSERSEWRLDLELVLVLISDTFSCIFAALQILYVKRNPHVLPMASLLMLSILTLGPAIPLVLNFEAVFLKDRERPSFYLENGTWLEAEKVLVRVATLLVFLFHFRLLQLSFSSRRAQEGGQNGKSSMAWAAEKRALLLSMPLYVVGAFAALLVNSKTSPENSVFGILKCYGGLVVDWFLLPQILMNGFGDSEGSALSIPFYVGTTLVRVVPHVYDLWRVNVLGLSRFDNGRYIYGDEDADFYTTAWDVVIVQVGVFSAVVVYLQQRFGGRFQKRLGGYEKVPVVSDA